MFGLGKVETKNRERGGGEFQFGPFPSASLFSSIHLDHTAHVPFQHELEDGVSYWGKPDAKESIWREEKAEGVQEHSQG